MGTRTRTIRDIDLTWPALLLRYLRAADGLLVITCGILLASLVTRLWLQMPDISTRELIEIATLACALIFSIWAGWRHVGVIDPRMWHAQFYALLAVLAVSLYTASDRLGSILDRSIPLDANFSLYLAPVLAVAAIALLSRAKVAGTDTPLLQVIARLTAREGARPGDFPELQRIAPVRGGIIAAFGAVFLLVWMLAPALLPFGYAGYWLLARARRHFQPRADSLLAVDKRSPILFLRSFEDDKARRFGPGALLDFSLETRLANHFMPHGPFIAIGSPQEKLALPGAARMQLPDEAWQDQVLAWIDEAKLIVLYAGKTYWVGWELEQVLHRAPERLILLVPESRYWFGTRRVRDLVQRFEKLRQTFAGTPWHAALGRIAAITTVRAILLRPHGRLIVIRSAPRNRDSFHLAAMIGHDLLASTSRREAAEIRATALSPPEAGEAQEMALSGSLLERQALVGDLGMAILCCTMSLNMLMTSAAAITSSEVGDRGVLLAGPMAPPARRRPPAGQRKRRPAARRQCAPVPPRGGRHLEDLAGALVRVEHDALGQRLERPAIHVQMADAAALDLDGMDVVAEECDAAARRDVDRPIDGDRGLPRRSPVVGPLPDGVGLDPVDGCDARPRGVIMWWDAAAGAHDVEVEGERIAGILRKQIARLEIVAGRSLERLGREQILAGREPLQRLEHPSDRRPVDALCRDPAHLGHRLGDGLLACRCKRCHSPASDPSRASGSR